MDRNDTIRLGTAAEQQDRTDAYFGDVSAYWRDVYEKEELQGRVYRERMQAALDWIYSLHLNPGAKILEVGGGAGWATGACQVDSDGRSANPGLISVLQGQKGSTRYGPTEEVSR